MSCKHDKRKEHPNGEVQCVDCGYLIGVRLSGVRMPDFPVDLGLERARAEVDAQIAEENARQRKTLLARVAGNVASGIVGGMVNNLKTLKPEKSPDKDVAIWSVSIARAILDEVGL